MGSPSFTPTIDGRWGCTYFYFGVIKRSYILSKRDEWSQDRPIKWTSFGYLRLCLWGKITLPFPLQVKTLPCTFGIDLNDIKRETYVLSNLTYWTCWHFQGTLKVPLVNKWSQWVLLLCNSIEKRYICLKMLHIKRYTHVAACWDSNKSTRVCQNMHKARIDFTLL